MGRDNAVVFLVVAVVTLPAAIALIRDLDRPTRLRSRVTASAGIVLFSVALMVVIVKGRLMCFGDEGDGCGGQPSYWIRLALLFGGLTAASGLALMFGPRRPGNHVEAQPEELPRWVTRIVGEKEGRKASEVSVIATGVALLTAGPMVFYTGLTTDANTGLAIIVGVAAIATGIRRLTGWRIAKRAGLWGVDKTSSS